MTQASPASMAMGLWLFILGYQEGEWEGECSPIVAYSQLPIKNSSDKMTYVLQNDNWVLQNRNVYLLNRNVKGNLMY